MRIKAVGLLSGGLDSTLAARLMLEEEIEVSAINFTSPFCTCTPKKAGCASVISAVRRLGNIPLKRVVLGDEYLHMIRAPRFGYGRGMNPCIDCRIIKIKKAAEYMREIGASFLFTGEVLGQRPMSQHRRALAIIDRESDVPGLILRPLSAAHFQATIPEVNGWVRREKLLAIRGRSRKEQIRLASEKGIRDYPCPAGGCLLTDAHFANRLKDYFNFVEEPSFKNIPLLKIGRHFRLENGEKVIVARNEVEGEMMMRLCRKEDCLIAPLDFSGPVVILQGKSEMAAIGKLLEYTNREVPDTARVRCQYQDKTRDITKEMWRQHVAATL